MGYRGREALTFPSHTKQHARELTGNNALHADWKTRGISDSSQRSIFFNTVSFNCTYERSNDIEVFAMATEIEINRDTGKTASISSDSCEQRKFPSRRHPVRRHAPASSISGVSIASIRGKPDPAI